jgi:hypothetical protein
MLERGKNLTLKCLLVVIQADLDAQYMEALHHLQPEKTIWGNF